MTVYKAGRRVSSSSHCPDMKLKYPEYEYYTHVEPDSAHGQSRVSLTCQSRRFL